MNGSYVGVLELRGDHEPASDDLQSLQLSCSKLLFSPDLCRDIPE